MSNELQTSELVDNITAFIGKQENHFVQLNEGCINRLDFAKECEFAKQQLLKNDYVLGVARSNPDSLHSAISNVAAIGISLNPALQFAYLVPRSVNKKPSICLDISYRGLTKLATDTGIIKAMKAELVYQNDTFKYHGFHEKPEFQANPFGDRGDLIGVYAMALMTDGSVLVEAMSKAEVDAIRDSAEAYKSAVEKGGYTYDNNVWVKFYTEMVKKTVIKRAYKTLPASKGTEILGKAVSVINEHEGIEFEAREPELHYTEEERAEYQRCIDEGDYYSLSALICSGIGADAQGQLYKLCVPVAEKGMKGKKSKEMDDGLREGSRMLEAALVELRLALDENQDAAATEIMAEGSKWVREYLIKRLTNEQQLQLKQMGYENG